MTGTAHVESDMSRGSDSKGAASDPMAFSYRWRVRTRLPERFGQRCQVLVRARMNSASVEFEDGYRVVTSRNYVRRA